MINNVIDIDAKQVQIVGCYRFGFYDTYKNYILCGIVAMRNDGNEVPQAVVCKVPVRYFRSWPCPAYKYGQGLHMRWAQFPWQGLLVHNHIEVLLRYKGKMFIVNRWEYTQKDWMTKESLSQLYPMDIFYNDKFPSISFPLRDNPELIKLHYIHVCRNQKNGNCATTAYWFLRACGQLPKHTVENEGNIFYQLSPDAVYKGLEAQRAAEDALPANIYALSESIFFKDYEREMPATPSVNNGRKEQRLADFIKRLRSIQDRSKTYRSNKSWVQSKTNIALKEQAVGKLVATLFHLYIKYDNNVNGYEFKDFEKDCLEKIKETRKELALHRGYKRACPIFGKTECDIEFDKLERTLEHSRPPIKALVEGEIAVQSLLEDFPFFYRYGSSRRSGRINAVIGAIKKASTGDQVVEILNHQRQLLLSSRKKDSSAKKDTSAPSVEGLDNKFPAGQLFRSKDQKYITGVKNVLKLGEDDPYVKAVVKSLGKVNEYISAVNKEATICDQKSDAIDKQQEPEILTKNSCWSSFLACLGQPGAQRP